MTSIIFNDGFKECFASSDLKSIDDFFNLDDGELVNRNSKRNVLAFSLGQGADKKDFFMKRFYQPHLKDTFAAFIDSGKFLSQARVEWRNANILLDNGIETYRPVCCGYDCFMGIEKRSFFVTRKLSGQSLAQYIIGNWEKLSGFERDKIIISMAKLVRHMHDAGISMPDLYIWHFFISFMEDTGEYEFALLDLHRMTSKRLSTFDRIRNIAALFYSMLDEYFDEESRQLFLANYISGDYRGFYRKVLSRVKVIQSRRKNPKRQWQS